LAGPREHFEARKAEVLAELDLGQLVRTGKVVDIGHGDIEQLASLFDVEKRVVKIA
jgi:hypothetical protein